MNAFEINAPDSDSMRASPPMCATGVAHNGQADGIETLEDLNLYVVI
jgi:hypothetical protein